jgi:DNA-binding NarL/FixJ family response regulator
VTIRVLVVDDQAMVRAGFRMLLSREPDLDVVGEACDGLEALEQVERLRPDVVLMDIRMPRLDGLAAARTLLAGADAPRVLVLTTFDLDEYVFEALQAGASGFVLKDDPPERLVAAVRTVAAGDAMLSPAVTRRVVERFTRLARPARVPALDALTARELDVLRLVAEGQSNAEIAQELFISEGTVKTHVAHLLHKLDLRDRVQAVVLAYRCGLVDR